MMKSRDARPASQKAPWRGGLLALAPAAARERPAQVNPPANRDRVPVGRGVYLRWDSLLV